MHPLSHSAEEKFWQLLPKKLCGEASAAELQDYALLLLQYPDWQLKADMITQMWSQQIEDFPDPKAEAAYIRHLVKNKEILFSQPTIVGEPKANFEYQNSVLEPQPGHGRAFWKNWKLITPVIFLVAATGWFFMSDTKDSLMAEKKPVTSSVTTKNGNRTKMVLPDGSQVWLNAGSRLDYKDKDYNKSIREVSLTGEAYFDVVKDKDKPFIIHTAKINIKVLGTTFNVKSYPEEKMTETSLVRGSVEVTVNNRPTEKYILKPNEKLVIANEEKPSTDKQGQKPVLVTKASSKNSGVPEPIVAIRHLSYLPEDSTIIETSWVENKLIFRKEAFEDLAMRMERWFDVSIRFENERAKKEKLTGIFESETIDKALKALQMTAAFKYKTNKNEIIIY
jgi:transmembrane sensor